MRGRGIGQHTHLDTSRRELSHPLDSRVAQHEIRRLDQQFALHLTGPLAECQSDDVVRIGVNPGGLLDENFARRPDEIVPDLDQARAEASELFVDGIGIAGGGEFFR